MIEKKHKDINNSSRHPRRFLSGISLTRYLKKGKALFTTDIQAGDSRQRHAGMTTLFNVHAFTLIELLVVVLIIGILAAIALPQYQLAVTKARVSRALVIATSIREAEEVYYLTNGEYTTNSQLLDIDMPGECKMVGSQAETPEENYIGRKWACGKDFLLDLTSDPWGVYIDYCPENNSYWQQCADHRDAVIQFYYANSTQGTKIACNKFNNSALGEKICKTLVAKS